MKNLFRFPGTDFFYFDVPEKYKWYDGNASGTDDSASGMDDSASGSDGNASGTDDSASGTDDNASGSDDNASGSDDSASGTDDNASGSDDNASGTDDSASDDWQYSVAPITPIIQVRLNVFTDCRINSSVSCCLKRHSPI